MNDLWSGPRRPQWIVEHLDRAENVIGVVSGRDGGSLSMQRSSRLGGRASLTILADDAAGINMLSDRLRILYDPGVDGLDPVPWGTYLFHLDGQRVRADRYHEVELVPKTAVLDRDEKAESYSLEKGTNIVAAVTNLIRSSGEYRIAATDSGEVTRSDLVWEAGTRKLDIVNELLQAGGYEHVWVDRGGQFRVEPLLSTTRRPMVREFRDDETSIYRPEWDMDHEMLAVPNQVIVIAPGDDTDDPIVAVARNDDPKSPFSTVNRGVISRREHVPDMASQAMAQAHANELLVAGMSPKSWIRVTHGIVPLDVGDHVGFGFEDEWHDGIVEEMTMTMTYDAQCSAVWRVL